MAWNDTKVDGSSTLPASEWNAMVAVINAKQNSISSISTQTGTSYTLAATDAGSTIIINSSSANTINIPTYASVPFSVGTGINFLQTGTGKVTFVGSGITINSKSGNKSIGAQYVGVTTLMTATNVWSLIGDLIA